MKGGYSFNDRVDKVFGSIPSSSSWSLTDAPVERREWNHRRNTDRDDDQIPVFSSSAAAAAADNIRSSIGLDSTLDHEEEEDAYDKMAQGIEDCSHRLYIKDVAHHGPYLNSHNLLPKSIHHPPAAATLKEDDDDDIVPMLNDAPPPPAEEASQDNNGGIPRIKSILKKRKPCDDDHHHELAKPTARRKRVRFDSSTCKNAPPHPDPIPLVVSQNRPGVPDYILNPSKYTRYTFDDGSCNNNNNNTLDFLESSLKHSATVEHESCGELPPKSTVVFIPRKKRGDSNNEEQVRKQQQQQSSTQGQGCSSSTIGIAAVEVQHKHKEDEEEEESHDVVDDVCTKARPVRQYRSKINDYDDDVS